MHNLEILASRMGMRNKRAWTLQLQAGGAAFIVQRRDVVVNVKVEKKEWSVSIFSQINSKCVTLISIPLSYHHVGPVILFFFLDFVWSNISLFMWTSISWDDCFNKYSLCGLYFVLFTFQLPIVTLYNLSSLLRCKVRLART